MPDSEPVAGQSSCEQHSPWTGWPLRILLTLDGLKCWIVKCRPLGNRVPIMQAGQPASRADCKPSPRSADQRGWKPPTRDSRSLLGSRAVRPRAFALHGGTLLPAHRRGWSGDPGHVPFSRDPQQLCQDMSPAKSQYSPHPILVS